MARGLLEAEKTEVEFDSSFYNDWDSEINRFRRQESPEPEPETKEYFLTPLYAITGFFAVMMFIGPFFVKRGPLRGIIQGSIMLAAFCMWIFWFTIYFGQMNPLMGPRLDNTTVAWIAYKLALLRGKFAIPLIYITFFMTLNEFGRRLLYRFYICIVSRKFKT